MKRAPFFFIFWLITYSSFWAASCTETELYQYNREPYRANKLTVSGTFCSDDPMQQAFPVKIMFVIDSSSLMISSNNDSMGYRVQAVKDVVTLWSKNANYSFGLVAFGGKAVNLLEGGKAFSRNENSDLNTALEKLSVIGGSLNTATHSRDLSAGVGLASSLITGDILETDPGEATRTIYVMVLFSGGAPVPEMGRCPCRDLTTENPAYPWLECDECQITCATLNGLKQECQKDPDTKLNYCTPVCAADCGGGFCDCSNTCNSDPLAVEPKSCTPLSQFPENVADTYTHYRRINNKVEEDVCTYPTSTSLPVNTQSCEEKTLINMVSELKDFARKNGVAQVQLHTTYLPNAITIPQNYQNYQWLPPCYEESVAAKADNNPNNDWDAQVADQARAIRVLTQMASAGGGGFQKFDAANKISFAKIDLHTNQDPLVIKELVVSNLNIIATPQGMKVDTDGDGITDEKEGALSLCPNDEDTDGDGISDGVELKVALDPRIADSPVECIDLEYSSITGTNPCNSAETKTWKQYTDKDQDNLNACEERLLGTSDSLYDSDADGLPDRAEFLGGTNYLVNDSLEDFDFDGLANREELRGHSDPQSNDAQDQLDLSYRYEQIDEGIKQVYSFSQPVSITGVQIKSISPATKPGTGRLKFDPGPPATLAWCDYEDFDLVGNCTFGPAVDISTANKEHRLYSCRADALDPKTCSAESQTRYINVFVEGENTYQTEMITEPIVISSSNRNCMNFRVRNITLMETGEHRLYKSRGNNIINLYFSEVPQGSRDSFGIFRVASMKFKYLKGPPEERTPRVADQIFVDEDFTLRK